MRGGTCRWLACLLAVAAVSVGSAGAWGQGFQGAPGAYRTWAGDSAPGVAYARAVFGEEVAPDLAARVAELEDQLKEMKDAEAKAKAKAAGRPSVRAGGRIMIDYAAFDQNAASVAQAGDFQNGTEIRRARMFLKGDAFEVIDYAVQFDFADTTSVRDAGGDTLASFSNPGFRDVYITVNELPVVGHVRVGHFKIPFSLEGLASTKNITFMERALPVFGLADGRRMGIATFDHNEAETSTWAIGAFATQTPDNPPIFQNDNGGAAAVMRYTYLPWYDEATDGRGLLHTGICYAYGDIADGETVRIRQRPEAHLANRVVDTGTLRDVKDLNALCLEAALVYGPFSVQAEYFSDWLDRSANPDPRFDGAYIYFSYFLTGEHRRYNRSGGFFDRVKPFENFFRVCDCDGNVQMGKGAWEVAYRYSYLDLNDAGTIGGEVEDHTFGVNWYLNPYTRMMFNYVHSETEDHPDAPGVGRVDLVEMRAQIDF